MAVSSHHGDEPSGLVGRAQSALKRKQREYQTALDRAWASGDKLAESLVGDEDGETRELKTGQMTGQFAMMIQVAVILAVGVLIVGSIFDALPTTSTLNGAETQVQDLTGQAFELAPIVLIVVVASLIVGVVRRI